MKFLKILFVLALVGLSGTALWAADIQINHSYFRVSSPGAKSGGAFMELQNSGAVDDRLIGARSDVAMRVEIHTSIDAGNGVMQMRKVEGGLLIPAGGNYLLARGGDHLMFMGLTRSVEFGEEITVILSFERAGEISVVMPVDLDRKPSATAAPSDN